MLWLSGCCEATGMAGQLLTHARDVSYRNYQSPRNIPPPHCVMAVHLIFDSDSDRDNGGNKAVNGWPPG
jgi:hypothetical protein